MYNLTMYSMGIEFITFLIEIDLQITDRAMGQNIFHIACSNGWDDFVTLLVKKPPKIKVTDRKSLKIDFKAKEKYERKISKINFEAKDKYNNTGFILACKYGWKNIVQYLLNHRNIVDIDIAESNTGKNCFLQAVLDKRVEVTKLFLSKSKSDEEIRQIICATNKRNETAFHMACIKGSVGNVKHSKKEYVS